MRIAVPGTLICALVLCTPSDGRAWDEGPLCTFDTSHPLADPSSTDGSSAMCNAPDSNNPVAPELWTRPLTAHEARTALEGARHAATSGDIGSALVSLRVVEWYAPEIQDRVALMRGDFLLAANNPRAACEAYRIAEGSVHPSVAVRARVGYVRGLLQAADPRAEEALDDLAHDYADLPNRIELRYHLGSARLLLGDIDGGMPILLEIDRNEPGSPWAARARQDLGRLAVQGVHVPRYSDEERVSRAERLLRSGPMEDARATVAELRASTAFAPIYRARIAMMAARIARVEGRFDDAQALLHEAQTHDPRLAESAAPVTDAAHESVASAAETRLRTMFQNRSLARQPVTQLTRALDTAARARMVDVTDAILAVLMQKRDATPRVRFDAAVVASGVATDAAIVALLTPLVGDGDMGPRARYHRARAYERMGQSVQARQDFDQVIASDHSEMRWYAMLARLRVRALDASPDHPSPGNAESKPSGDLFPWATAERALPADDQLTPIVDATLAPAQAEALLVQVLPHAGAYPWIRRALVLVRLRELDAAGDELHEAYLAVRQARGRGVPRAGLEAVYRGTTPRLRNLDAATRRARLLLTSADYEKIADAATKIGDHGVAVAFGGRTRAASHPRAYASAVMAAAARHHIDPDLLFAVMRVESVFDRRIVSYAGAIGLMQIMPRTANLIANRLGRTDFTMPDLLDPNTNVEFAAWYLASLLQRFDGRLPLAIAAYNGGPHNVRQWLNGYSSSMPLDAFLERIPFEQTYRYVRRVLGHYSAYRSARNLPMVMLDTTLPEAAVDHVAF
ncbi:MAG: lytic transglycosylase domain-containing protein [Sandaracinaceae bacterium]|nr:lytic transglycosylase domain-containing protein [Sandaracinaceae bacterium]